jgi:superfamily II DNA or RNA helicase
MLQQFKSGALRVLCNVNLLIEGVDIPSIEVVQWLRPTKSLIIWMQGNGRGLRPHAGIERLLILDHVGNWSRPGFGLPDAPRSWSLDGRKARAASAEDGESFDIRQCPQCFSIYRAKAGNCPSCSAPAGTGAGKPDIEVVEGKLAVIEREAARKAERIEQGMAKNLRDLVQLGIRKGIKHADAWAANVHAGRSGQKPTKADYDLAAVMYSEEVNGRAELWPV